MQAFTTVTGIAASLPMINIDTDMIIAKQFLKTIKRTGLGVHLFHDMRYDANGQEVADFVLNKEPFRNAQILVAGDNFGCGSSREHAPWSLLDFGITCVIAPSFADIFFNNCFKNGILPIKLPQEQIDALTAEIENAEDPTFTVDLEKQEIHRPSGNEIIKFEVESFRKHCLLNGLDDIGLTLQKAPSIDTYEASRQSARPWLERGTAA